jgi:hypothetical protein
MVRPMGLKKTIRRVAVCDCCEKEQEFQQLETGVRAPLAGWVQITVHSHFDGESWGSEESMLLCEECKVRETAPPHIEKRIGACVG